MLKLNDAKKILNNLQKAGGKLANGVTFKSATSKILPVVEASMVLNQVREIPVLKEIMTGFDKVTEFVMDKMLANVPVIGWFAKQFHDHIMKPVGKITGGYREAENDRTWYTGVRDVSLPKTEERPSNLGLVSDVALADVTGGIPRMQHMNINIFKLDKMECFTTQMTNLWENIIHGIKRSYTYSLEDISIYILNSISYYIVGKYFEKKIGFMKFEDPSFPDFKEQWSLTYNQAGPTGLVDAEINPMLNIADKDNGFTSTKEYYTYIVELHRSFLLPKSLKQWIDHYFGSVFLIDDDVHNWKITDINPVVLYFYYYDTTDKVIKSNAVQLTSITIQDYYTQLVNFFKQHATIRADLDNAMVFSSSYDQKTPLLDIMELGWFTDYQDYKPEITKSQSFIQALINAYTDGVDFGLAFKNNMVRFDYIDDNGAGDELTTILFAGAAVPSTNPFLRDGHLSVNNVSLVLNGTPQLPVTLPYTWVYPGTPGGNTIYTSVTTPKVAIIRSNAQEYDRSRIIVNGGTTVTTEISEVLESTEITQYPGLTVKKASVTENFGAGRFNLGIIALKAYRETFSDIYRGPQILRAVNELINNAKVLIHIFDTPTSQYYIGGEVSKVSDTHYRVVAVVDAELYSIDKSDKNFNGMPIIIEANKQSVSYLAGVSENIHLLVYDSIASDLQLEYDACTDVFDHSSDLGGDWINNQKLPYYIDLYFTIDSNYDQILVSYDCVGTGEDILYSASTTPAFSFRSAGDLPEKAYYADNLTRLYIYDQPATVPVDISFQTDARNANYNEWCQMAMGYSIPIILEKFSQVSVYQNGTFSGETLNRSFVLMKEDYVPFFINRSDLPWVLYYMYASLCHMELLPYKKK